MTDFDWYDDEHCNGYMVGFSIRGTSWNTAIKDNPEMGDVFPFIYDESGKFWCFEGEIESRDYEDEDDDDYPYPTKPSSLDYKKWVSNFVEYALQDNMQDFLKIPMKVVEKDGFFVLGVGEPCGNMGMPRIHIFYSCFQNQTCEYMIWEPDDPNLLFQENNFMFGLLSKLKRSNKLPSSINPCELLGELSEKQAIEFQCNL